MMPGQVDVVEPKKAPRRPFGVYVVVILLMLGVFAGLLEILRAQYSLTGIWIDTDEFFRRRSGIGLLLARVFVDPLSISIANGVLMAVWLTIMVGLWLLQRWAWVLLMILIGVILAYLLVLLFEGAPVYVGMLLYVAMAFYLNDNSVQRTFARRRPQEVQ